MAKSGLGSDPESCAAITVLSRAVKLDEEGRYQPALVCYQEGIDLLLQVLRGELPAVEGSGGGRRSWCFCRGEHTAGKQILKWRDAVGQLGWLISWYSTALSSKGGADFGLKTFWAWLMSNLC